jgi:hypothetical protein
MSGYETPAEAITRWWNRVMANRAKKCGEEACPYPARGKPDAYPARRCVEDGDCGCDAKERLAEGKGESQ